MALIALTPAQARSNPWVPMAVVVASTIVITLDSTIISVVLHPIGEDLGVTAGIEWLVTAYVLAICASQPAAGWLANRFGHKPMFLVSLAWFAIASSISGIASTFALLLVGRVLQGLACGVLSPIGMAMVMDLFPPDRRGRAVAAWGVAAMAAPAFGPTVGGWLADSVSWHWVFLISVPFAAVGFVAGIWLLPDTGRHPVGAFDAAGLMYGASGLVLFVLGVSQGGRWGWGSSTVVGLISIGVVLLVAFVLHERREEHPLVELSLLTMPDFRVPLAVLMLSVPSEYCRVVFMPLQLQEARDYTSLRVGMFFIPAATCMAIGMQFSGRLTDAIGPRRPVVFGSVGTVIALVSMSQLDVDSALWLTIAVVSLHGLASGLVTSAGLSAGIGRLPKHLLSQGSALRVLCRQISSAVSIAAFAAFVHTLLPSSPTSTDIWGAYGYVYLFAAAFAAMAIVFAIRLPDTPAVIDAA